FAIFLGFLALHSVFPLPELTDQILRLVVLTLVLVLVARPVIDLRVQRVTASILLGVAVFALWIAPDLLFPGYRQHWLFENSITGSAKSTLAADAQMQPAVLILRTLRAVVIVPIVEELFWRGWLMRWLIAADFRSVPLGAYSAQAFWVVALLFASEHGAYWDVGLMAGIAYNWWMLRTRSLGDLILAHAVTNACLSAYVIVAKKWEYWL
ncbi:MAG TPA: CAAX prenyl protease-related protein, partial [Bryobacteraceae bacterium]|nr:CAAX prenyl protease-related protein [Bryobacteraceae bacterium]